MNKVYYINGAKCSKEVFDNYMDLLHENKHLKDLQKNMDKQYEELEERVNKATKFYTHELFKREQLGVPQNMPWESVEMFNILEGNK